MPSIRQSEKGIEWGECCTTLEEPYPVVLEAFEAAVKSKAVTGILHHSPLVFHIIPPIPPIPGYMLVC
jgi:hypothetical protein